INDKDTLAEPTFGGVHLVFEYDSDIPKCKIIIDGVGVDVETDGGQVVIEPSIVYGYDRKFNNNKIIKLPDNIKKLILEQKGTKKEEPKQDNIILSGSEDELTFEKLRGNRSNTIIQLAGVLRKIMPAKNVKFTLNLFNNLLDKKLPQGELSRLFEQMEKYYVADSEQLKKDVVDFLVRHNEASIKDLIDCLGADKNDMLSALSDLIQDNKIFKQKHMYKTIEKAEWKTAFIEESKILPYNTPYFHNYVTLRRGDMICLGAKTGIGKGHISLNIIKKLVEDGVKPKGGINYLSSEPGNRFASIAMSLGLKEGDFRFANNYNPERLELEDDAITIVDWLLPSEYNLTAHLYKIFAQQLDRHGGLCYIFSQLKENGDFYAEPMVKFYASLAVKYFYGTKNGTVDNINTFFESVKARESKIGHQYFKIPTRYDVDTKLLELK
ncbi:MAG: hypothetical protein M0R03_23745, partial [Novosphingobium sp.]|nr:hypothetical protein [Novosphingobium sp.]